MEEKKSTFRKKEEKDKIIKRLNIVNGQINGIKQMIEDDRYCGDVLIQVAAVESAIKSIGNHILENHLKGCVTRDIKNGDEKIMDEVMDLVKKLQ